MARSTHLLIGGTDEVKTLSARVEIIQSNVHFMKLEEAREQVTRTTCDIACGPQAGCDTLHRRRDRNWKSILNKVRSCLCRCEAVERLPRI